MAVILPKIGTPNIKFVTRSNLLVANGYNRVVIGGRGAYIEFLPEQIVMDSIYMPLNCQWRLHSDVAFYLEYRSKCESKIKLYFQLKTVDYADYKIDHWYIAPSLLISDKYPILSF